MKGKSVLAMLASFVLLASVGANAGMFDKGEEDASAGAAGEAGATGSSDMFTALDVNQDQLISPREAEANADVAMSFGELDSNTDGHLSADEFSEFEGISDEEQ